MDAKSGAESGPGGPQGGDKVIMEHDSVSDSRGDTSRKNNTEATASVSEKARGNDEMAQTAKSTTDISAQTTTDGPIALPKSDETNKVTGVTFSGTESVKKPAESHPKERGVSAANGTAVIATRAPSETNDSTKGDGIKPVDSGNDQVTVDGSKQSLATVQPAVQTAASSAQPVSVLSPSLASSTGKTPHILKTVSFSDNVDVSAGIAESKNQQSAQQSKPLTAVQSVGQIPLKHHTAASVTSKAPPIPQSSTTADATKPPAATPPAPTPPSVEETIKKLRAPLVDKYSSFIAPNDTSLAAARKRLQTALDETRILRAAFTDRVYEKYRVLLHPVPQAVEPVIERIKADPARVSLKLQEEMRLIKQEKEIEKKETQKLHAAVAANTAIDGMPLNSRINAQETAEQLAWFNSGLNIVILPEEDIDDDMDMSKYPHRGPTNPETGARVSGISAAAAAAAEGLLDRVRRGAVMRMERQRRRQLQLLSGEDTEAEADSSAILSHLHLLSTSSIARTAAQSSGTLSAGKSMKRGAGGSRGSASFAPPHAKTSRGRSQVSLTGSSLLSLNPQAEELTTQGVASTAATAALISRGVGSATNSKTAQQRWVHPHPESHGGRRLAATTQSSNKKLDRGGVTGVPPIAMSAYLALALPPLPTAKERKEKKPLPVMDAEEAATERGRTAVHCVLSQFFTNQESDSRSQEDEKKEATAETEEKSSSDKQNDIAGAEAETTVDIAAAEITGDSSTENSKSPEESTRQPKFVRRRVTEIGLLRGMQQMRDQAEAKLSEKTAARSTTAPPSVSDLPAGTVAGSLGDNATTDQAAEEPMSKKPPIDPILAFSVLNALGLVHEASKPSHHQDQTFLSRILNSTEGRKPVGEAGAEPNPKSEISTESLTDTHKQKSAIQNLVSRKRVFSDAFSQASVDGAYTKRLRGDSKDKSPDAPMIEVENTIPDSSESPVGALDQSHAAAAPEKEPGSETSAVQNPPDVENSLIASIRGGGEVILGSIDVNRSASEESTEEKKPTKDPSDHVAVSSIRGGGEILRNSSDEGTEKSNSSTREREEPAVPRHIASGGSPQTSSIRDGSMPEQQNTAWGGHLTSLTRSTSSPSRFSPPGSAASNGVRMQGPQHTGSPVRSVSHPVTAHERYIHSQVPPLPVSHTSLHHQPGASMSRPLTPGEMPEFFGGIHRSSQPHGGFVSPPHEWSSLGAAAAGLLPTHSSLAALGIDSHRAAMVSLSVRERAARVLLAREQAHAAVVHRQAAAVRGGAGVSGFSPHQAAVLMGASASHANSGLYRHATAPNAAYGRLGPRSVSSSRAVTSSPADSQGAGSGMTSPASRASSTPASKRQQQGTRTALSTQGSSSTTKAAGSKTDENPGPRDMEAHDNSGAGIPQSHKGTNAVSNSSNNGASSERKAPLQTFASNEGAAVAEGEKNEGGGSAVSDPVGSKTPTGSSSSPTDGASSKTPNIGVSGETNPSSEPNASRTGHRADATPSTSIPVAMDISPSDEPDEIPTSVLTSGMRFFVPSPPGSLSKELADSVVGSRIHVAVASLASSDSRNQEELSSERAASLLAYLLAVGAAVPIPKALVSNPLKERLNTPGFKSAGNGGSPTIPRDVVVAAILVWLWVEHKDSFQRAFAKSGRIDVDPECKWLILAAVDAAVRALMLEIADSVARGGPLAALGSTRNKPSSVGLKTPTPTSGDSEGEKLSGSSTKLDIQIASIVSEALMTELCIDEDMDFTLAHFEELVKQLDETRTSALRAKSTERALLAVLISRRATMSEPFSHSYVSSMVRAGEALGHEALFEAVQHEATATSTMIPYDIFSDETGAWEDPCRVATGFTPNLAGDDMTRRAHARAMIEKSLKKLQDRHNMRGGTPTAGPYADPLPSSESGGTSGSPNSVTDGRSTPGTLQRSNSGLKRKASFSLADLPVPPGTGSASATTIAQYRPNHHSAPLIWDSDDLENSPYGRHTAGTRKRALSLGPMGFSIFDSGGKASKKSRGSRSLSISVPSISGSDDVSTDPLGIRRSTEEINWTDVANIFEPVTIPAPTTPRARKAAEHAAVPVGTTIIAPFCRKVESLPEDSASDDDSEDEDLSDAAVLARHRVVLDEMKKKLEKFMKARQNAKQRGARRSSSSVK